MQEEAKRIIRSTGLTVKQIRRLRNIWKGCLARCGNIDNEAFHHRYGGRGIEVCLRWCWFEYFVADMGYPPEGHR